MLDYRHLTFLTLCKTRSYTKAAEQLKLTQPAVTQHIQFLEKQYKFSLFKYQNKKLELTENGKSLYQYVQTLQADSTQFVKNLIVSEDEQYHLTFGATLSVGEFLMPTVLKKILKEKQSLSLTMLVDNTDSLLKKIKTGELQFAMIEGYFNQTEFDSFVLKEEKYIPVCAANSPLAKGEYKMEDLINYNIVVRENGSGSRAVLESILNQNYLSLDNFRQTLEIGNIYTIKELVAEDLGISFFYKMVVNDDIKKNRLHEIKMKEFSSYRKLHFVYLKNSIHAQEYQNWFEKIRNNL